MSDGFSSDLPHPLIMEALVKRWLCCHLLERKKIAAKVANEKSRAKRWPPHKIKHLLITKKPQIYTSMLLKIAQNKTKNQQKTRKSIANLEEKERVKRWKTEWRRKRRHLLTQSLQAFHLITRKQSTSINAYKLNTSQCDRARNYQQSHGFHDYLQISSKKFHIPCAADIKPKHQQQSQAQIQTENHETNIIHYL